MSKSNSIGITTLRQKLRKYIKDNHDEEIKIYKEVRFECIGLSDDHFRVPIRMVTHRPKVLVSSRQAVMQVC
jgi:hypothetical protein